MSSYGQFCPVAKAMELLDERWTMLVVRELLSGSTHFNDLRRGVPRMSPTLLSKRLQTLIRAGVVQRIDDDGHPSYVLTQCGRELIDVVTALGSWSLRWIGDLGDQDLDPHLLMWDIRRTVPTDRWPAGRTVVAFRLSGVAPKAASWWLIVADGRADICDFDPGYDIAATVSTSLRTLTQVWRGDLAWSHAVGNGSITIDGPSLIRRSIPNWIGQSTLAPVPRPA
ncbi:MULTISPECIES: helix-turn-helix domain-containing protein [unclassified Mycobacterium]|uniref:winged helix-turn-helix transcriptional regulator n=1 Tax=unclassified Mycobacterium TaxID=2642494 RepID=UPI00074007D9|nr:MULTISPECIES: helix-turn-helix domain-containing protein [unclassified Mycobacterium]KUH83878.1 HxlR family transcriptional regulator [Mycobacterium sp. IS-1556]KUH88463.1 HxlR family transcriptional regulator [Mycobacterium sp. GA-0227b]KUH89667.1 HxlR family transcriptional regulator [Mycobacterium sp. GA-1999]